jgi:hypothetical protein
LEQRHDLRRLEGGLSECITQQRRQKGVPFSVSGAPRSSAGGKTGLIIAVRGGVKKSKPSGHRERRENQKSNC